MKVSVVVAIYNGEAFLEKQLKSILSQTYPPDEVLLCDDCSSDGSLSIAQQFICRNSLQKSWKLISNRVNKGYVKNFYSGIEKTSADLIFLCDQDDIWVNDKINQMVDIMEAHPRINVLSSAFGVIDANDKPLRGILLRRTSTSGGLEEISVDAVLRSYHWPGMSMVIRKDFASRIISEYENCKAAHDFVFSLLAAEYNSFFFYDEKLCFHRRHGSNVAMEEHRIRKLLDLSRKTREMDIYNEMLKAILDNGSMSFDVKSSVLEKYEFSTNRKLIIERRRFLKLFKLYYSYKKAPLSSMLCDIWLIIFGRQHA